MSEENLLKIAKRCKMELVQGQKRKIGIKLPESSLDEGCIDFLKDLSNKLGPESRKYLSRRLIPETPKVEEILEQLNLRLKKI